MLTTPNRDYNAKFPALANGALRHRDHRFEWTRAEFAEWAQAVAMDYGYAVVLSGIGDKRSGTRPANAGGGVHMHLTIPDFSLVVLMGATGSGKSTFAAKHFLPTEIISSDRCRGWVADDETDQSATTDAFDVLYYLAAKRLAARRLTVIDATNLRSEDRQKAVELARKYHALPVAIAINMPGKRLCRTQCAAPRPPVRRACDTQPCADATAIAAQSWPGRLPQGSYFIFRGRNRSGRDRARTTL